MSLPIVLTAVSELLLVFNRALQRCIRPCVQKAVWTRLIRRCLADSHPLTLALSFFVYGASAHELAQRTAADAIVATIGSDVLDIADREFWRSHASVVHMVATTIRDRLVALTEKIVPREASWEDACRLAYAIRIGQVLVSVSGFAMSFTPRPEIAPVLLENALQSMPASTWLGAARLAHQLRFHQPLVDESERDECVGPALPG